MRIATYNVENLFSRPVVLNMEDNDKAARILEKIAEFTKLLQQKEYSPHKRRIEKLYGEIGEYVEINIRSSQIGRYVITTNQGLIAEGREDWDGFVDLKRERFSEQTIKFTGKVIKEIGADIQCLIEVESADTLRRFNSDILGSIFQDRIVIDGNDPRGIDIALAARKGHPILVAKTNIFARDKVGTIFSRDCLEVELSAGRDVRIHVLVNHFKAKDRNPEVSDEKRRRQAVEVSRILRTRYNLKKDFVVVAGDLNDEPKSKPLASLMRTPDLINVLDVAGIPVEDRWTYYYGLKKQYNTIDYLFVSKALARHVTGAGIERRGIFDLEKLTGGKQKSFKGIDNWKLAASDHGAVWADLDL
jgi:endonuclease/exonuclease/phosphatase family metal-dependent hydrolase